MAGLSSSTQLGNASPTSLVKSASSLQAAVANYQDQIQALTYANSAYTDEAFQAYQNYLTGRITQLNSTGSVTNASKALTLTKTMESAMHSNISASITRENIQIMAGNAALPDKYNLIVNQYQRAFNNGDMTLAQTLMGQAYSVSQQIQYQAQQAADAAATLARAGGGSSGDSSSTATDEGQRATNLHDFLAKQMNGDFKNISERQLNDYAAKYANDPATKQWMQAMGVKITTQQPTYWDLVYGVAGAQYAHLVLKAQAESAVNPLLARNYAMDAHALLNGSTKIPTLAGDLTVQQLQQAQQDPSMFAYDNSTGSFKPTTIIGYQYMNMDNGSGGKSPQLVPTYSGITSPAVSNNIYFLTPQETTMMTKLGLNFTENVGGQSVASNSLKPGKSGTTGDGALVQATENSPLWLQKVLGKNGVANMYTDNNGFVTFKAGATNPDGTNNSSFFTLAMDNKGLGGLFEHLPDGSSKLVGGDYGFAGQAVQMLINAGQRTQFQVIQAQQQAEAALKVQQVQAQQQLQAQTAQAQSQARASAAAQAAAAHTQAQRLQPAISPQAPTYNPQQAASPQPPTFNPQQTVNGPNLNQSGTHGIATLHGTSGPSIRL
jgi:hypothetical protein